MNKFKDVKKSPLLYKKIGNLSFLTCLIEIFQNIFTNCS